MQRVHEVLCLYVTGTDLCYTRYDFTAFHWRIQENP
jgi:hypothetical protein